MDIITLEKYWTYGEMKYTILLTLMRNTNVCVDIYIHTNIYVCVYSVCAYIYIYIYTYICVCVYIYISQVSPGE